MLTMNIKFFFSYLLDFYLEFFIKKINDLSLLLFYLVFKKFKFYLFKIYRKKLLL